jgi:hypothetical protein
MPRFFFRDLYRLFKDLRGDCGQEIAAISSGCESTLFLISRHIVPNVPTLAFLMSRHIVPDIPKPVPDIPIPPSSTLPAVPNVPTLGARSPEIR